jgi:hypothetical protein
MALLIAGAAFLLYVSAYYLTYRPAVNSYGLGPIDFPNAAAHSLFKPARMLDEHVLRLKPRIDRSMNEIVDGQSNEM